MSKRPAFQFYPGDWRTDPGLRLCTMLARGLWIEMMTIMHEGEPYGHLTAQGRPISDDMLARLVGESPAAVKRAIKDLEDNNVFSVTPEGVIFSPMLIEWRRRGQIARRQMTTTLRRAVFRRDGRRCRYCRTRTGPFHIDHIFPVSRGGESILSNLAVACLPCNRSKGVMTLEEWIS